jgi:hypothetical protein
MYIEGEVPYVTGNNCYGNNNGFGFGNGWEGLIGLALVAALFGGWGNGGFGFGGARGGFGGIAENYALATDFATVERKLDGVNAGICDSTFALNNTIVNGNFGIQNSLTQGFAGLNSVINQGFAGVDNAICTLGYNQASLINGLSRELSDCCCKTNLAIQDLKYSNERQTCDLITNQNNNTRAILDYLTNEKIEGLRAENVALKGQISNDRQSAYIIDALAPKCPQPAYVVQPPQQVTFPTNCCGNVAYANYNNSGCGCC